VELFSLIVRNEYCNYTLYPFLLYGSFLVLLLNFLVKYLKRIVCFQIHWPATAQRKGECKLTGKGGQVQAVLICY